MTAERDGVIIIGLNEPDAMNGWRRVCLRWEAIRRDRVYTVQASTHNFEGMRLQRVYLTGRAATAIPQELSQYLVRMALPGVPSGRWEGFFLVNDDGSLHGPSVKPNAIIPEAL